MFPDNSAQDNSARTIRRGQFGAAQFRADKSTQSICYKFYREYPFHTAIFFSSIPVPFQQSIINPSSISAILFSSIINPNPNSYCLDRNRSINRIQNPIYTNTLSPN